MEDNNKEIKVFWLIISGLLLVFWYLIFKMIP
jgi:hypothetical protein